MRDRIAIISMLAVSFFIVLALAGLLSPSAARAETLAPVLSQPLPGGDGRSFTAARLEFPPAARAAPHTHGQAFVFAYVLEGRVLSQLEGGRPVVYRAGQAWSEPPGAHHLRTENLSASRRARLLVVFVAPAGAPLKTDDSSGEKQ